MADTASSSSSHPDGLTKNAPAQQPRREDHSFDGMCLLRSAYKNPPPPLKPGKEGSDLERSTNSAAAIAAPEKKAFTYLEMLFDIHDRRQAGSITPTAGSRPSSADKAKSAHQARPGSPDKKHTRPDSTSPHTRSISPGKKHTSFHDSINDDLSQSTGLLKGGNTPTLSSKKKSVSFTHGTGGQNQTHDQNQKVSSPKTNDIHQQAASHTQPPSSHAPPASLIHVIPNVPVIDEDSHAPADLNRTETLNHNIDNNSEKDPAKAKDDEAALKIQCAQRQRAARQEVTKLKGEKVQQQQQQQPQKNDSQSGTKTPPPSHLDETAITVTETPNNNNNNSPSNHDDTVYLPGVHGGGGRQHSDRSLPLSPNVGPAAPPCTPAVLPRSILLHEGDHAAVVIPTCEPLLVSPEGNYHEEQQHQQQLEEEEQKPEPYSARTVYHSTGRFGAGLSAELKPTKLVPHPPKTSRSLAIGDSPSASAATTKKIASNPGEILAQEENRGVNSPPRAKRFIEQHKERQIQPNVSPRAPRMSDLPDDAVERANALTTRAQKLIERANNNSECDWNEVRELFFRAGTLYQDAQLHEEAGAAFSNAASVSQAVGDHQEVASAASFAVDSLRETDPVAAIHNLLKLLDAYEASGNRLFVAREAKNLAQLFEETTQDKESALKYYTMANQVYAERNNGKGREGGTKSLYIDTLRKMAFLAVELGSYKYAQSLADELSKQQPQWRTQWLLLACLCAIAEGNDPAKNPTAIIARAKRDFEGYQDRERAFQTGFEYSLVKGILESWEAHSLSTYDQAQSRYESGRGVQVDIAREKGDRLAACFAALLEVCRENLFEFLRPYL